MSKKVKLFILITSTVAAVLFGLFAYISAKVLQSLHQDCRPLRVRILMCSLEAKEEYYPSLFPHFLLRASMHSSVKDLQEDILSLAKTQKECAVLIENSRDDIIDVFAAVEA